MGIKDNRVKKSVATVSIPAANSANYLGFVTVSSLSYFSVSVFNSATASTDLSLWNFFWSAAIDTNNTNGLYYWPYGTSLTPAQQGKIVLIPHYDWYQSNDGANVRTETIFIQNNDSSSHIIYLYYKAYTQPVIGGSIV